MSLAVRTTPSSIGVDGSARRNVDPNGTACTASARIVRDSRVGDVTRLVADVRTDLPRARARVMRRHARRASTSSTMPGTTTRPATRRFRAATPKSCSESCSAPAVGARRGRRRQQALVGVLAGAVSGRRARCIPRADGARPHRPDLRHAAARHDPEGVTVREVVESTAGLIASGMARHWAVAMWSASQLGEALDIASELGAPASGCEPAGLQPRAARERRRSGDRRADGESRCRPRRLVRARRRHADRQVHRRRARSRAMTTLPRTAPANGWPSPSPSWRGNGESRRRNSRSATRSAIRTSPSALFGATSPEQLRENVASYAVYESLGDEQLAAIEPWRSEPPRQRPSTDDCESFGRGQPHADDLLIDVGVIPVEGAARSGNSSTTARSPAGVPSIVVASSVETRTFTSRPVNDGWTAAR